MVQALSLSQEEDLNEQKGAHLLPEELDYYLKLYGEGTLDRHLNKKKSRAEHHLKLLELRAERDVRPLRRLCNFMAYAIATLDSEKRQHSLDLLPPIQYYADGQDERLRKTLFKCDAMLKECKAIVDR